MLFVALYSAKEGAPEKGLEAYVRRTRWEYPSGIKVLGEYWLLGAEGGPEIVVVFDSSDVSEIMAVTDAWSDVFDIRIAPAVTADEGIKLMLQSMRATPV